MYSSCIKTCPFSIISNIYILRLDGFSFISCCMKNQVVQKYDLYPLILKVANTYFLKVPKLEFKMVRLNMYQRAN